MEDLGLEQKIAAAEQELLNASITDEKHAAFSKMQSLIAQRSPEVVAAMEREKGLRL